MNLYQNMNYNSELHCNACLSSFLAINLNYSSDSAWNRPSTFDGKTKSILENRNAGQYDNAASKSIQQPE